MNDEFKFDQDGRGIGNGYEWHIDHPGAFALATIRLQAGSSISAEAGAMVSMSSNIELKSQMKGGVFGALKRAVGGESAFVSTFTAEGGPGEVTLAPATPGDVVGIELAGSNYLVQSSSYLAGDSGLTIDTKFGGLKSFLGGEGLFVLHVSGTGLLLVSSFGSISRKQLHAGERYVVDTGLFSSMLSGEGLVAEFTGPGEILLQTRNLRAFASQLAAFLPTSVQS